MDELEEHYTKRHKQDTEKQILHMTLLMSGIQNMELGSGMYSLAV